MNPLQSAALAEVKTLSFDFPESHKLAKAEALDAAKAVEAVNNQFDNSLCVSAQTLLKARRDYVEKWRTTAKRPIIDLGRLIEEVAATEVQEINDQWNRLQRLASGFAEKQKRAREEQERKRQEELDRIEADRVAKLNAVAAAPEAERDVETAKINTQANAETRNVILATKPTPKPQGQSVRSRWDFEVVDAGELYHARPDLCVIVEKRAEILKELAAGRREIAGLRIFEDVKAGVRT